MLPRIPAKSCGQVDRVQAFPICILPTVGIYSGIFYGGLVSSTQATPRVSFPIHVTVNGVERSAEIEPRLLLVHFLREHLGLTGTHVGCDTTQCGACTVHLN